jgi:hypothetical protein
MSIRIRVYPQYGGAYGGLGGYGFGMNRMGAVSASTYYNTKLQTQRQVSALQLGYERALWNERLEKVRLEERLKNPYAMMGAGFGAYPMASAYNPYASSLIGSSLLGGSGFFGSLGLGGLF